MTTALVVGPADVRDQRWLAEQVATLGDGIEAARNIWTNWDDGRHVGRFHPDMSPGEYIASLGFRLTLAEAMAALPDGSTGQVARVAGVSDETVRRARSASTNVEPGAEPARVIGADGKSYPGRVIGTADIIEPVQPEKGAIRHRATLTEVRQQVRILQGIFAMLRPDEVVPTAEPVLRELVPAVLAWVQLWSTEHEDA